MNPFNMFTPKEIIRNIPCIRTAEGTLSQRDSKLLKQKLLDAETYTNIIRLARGEGRRKILDEIVQRDDILFDWGVKGQHAFLAESPIRDFLEPQNIDVDQMKEIVRMYRRAICHRLSQISTFSGKSSVALGNANRDFTEELVRIIDKNTNNREVLFYIKDWICFILHTAGAYDFRNVSPWVSTSAGPNRYKTAYLFGQGKMRYLKTNSHGFVNSRFVIFDTWICPREEHDAYERTEYLRKTLAEIGLPWYLDIHHEIILKYAIYPQRLIGYYYFENDELLYYYANPHYIDKWRHDSQFKIGDYLYIDQENVKFPAENPYRIIYSKVGESFYTFDRR